MGGRLGPSPKEGRSPRFLVTAQKDAVGGANLDRIQIVKGWLGPDGSSREKVHDIGWSGERRPGPDGNLPPVGSTVDEDGATFRNTIGSAELSRVWTDPDFDPAQPSFYYVRVLEIPTPRWVLHDRAKFGAQPPGDAVLVHQERAYSSPIWYVPDRPR
jgi:hypothetical protein